MIDFGDPGVCQVVIQEGAEIPRQSSWQMMHEAWGQSILAISTSGTARRWCCQGRGRRPLDTYGEDEPANEFLCFGIAGFGSQDGRDIRLGAVAALVVRQSRKEQQILIQ